MIAQHRAIGSTVRLVFEPDVGAPDGGAAVEIQPDYTNFSFNSNWDVADLTAGNERGRFGKPTIEGMDFTLGMYFSVQPLNNYLKALIRKQEVLNEPLTEKTPAEGILHVLSEGYGVGKPFMSFQALFTGMNYTSPFDGAVDLEFSGQRQGQTLVELLEGEQVLPVAENDAVSVDPDDSETLNVLDNDTLGTPEGWVLAYGATGTLTTSPGEVYTIPESNNVTVVIEADGSTTVTAPAGATAGPYTVQYRLGFGANTDTANLVVTVTGA
jgi:hypothetical protein